jgi:hypothetical protein
MHTEQDERLQILCDDPFNNANCLSGKLGTTVKRELKKGEIVVEGGLTLFIVVLKGTVVEVMMPVLTSQTFPKIY